jgi:hypothetical protein
MAMNIESLAAAYLRYEKKDRTHQRAFDKVWDWVHNDPEMAWQFTLCAMNRCKDDAQLAYLAAGPLEDLLKKYGPQFIDRIEDEARKSEKMVRALSGVWLNDRYWVFPKWYAIMEKYGYTTGRRQAL